MKRIIGIILFFNVIASLNAQDISFTFMATHLCGHAQIDSVIVENLTQGGDTTLYFPDTVLTFIFTGIDIIKAEESDFYVSQNYPNPFKTKTEIDVFVPEIDNFTINVYDLTGRHIAGYQDVFEHGMHNFTFYAGSSKTYILTVMSEQRLQHIKMLQFDKTGNNLPQIKYNGMSSKEKTEEPILKQKSPKTYFPYEIGDDLKYTGFFNGDFIEITDFPVESQKYYFHFDSHEFSCPDTVIDTRNDTVYYNVVQMGCQCWLLENLRYLPQVDNTSSITDPKYYVYNYNGTDTIEAKAHTIGEINVHETYGALYNWVAATSACPMGWVLPSNKDWKDLEVFVGMTETQTDSIGWRGTNEGSKLAGIDTLWQEGALIEDPEFETTGFNVIPGGGRYDISGLFVSIGLAGNWWSSTEGNDSDNAWYRHIHYSRSNIYQDHFVYSKGVGRSVRCIKGFF